eukprot:Lithocolla_globosa_v1_NODE_3162_length_1744_cov_8.686797.p1 type:complete len:350 gc:universal NODE_3162_length_1744_cov_8.686797:2-1051(+)
MRGKTISAAQHHSQKIDKELQSCKPPWRVLLLGQGQSGKRTVMRQWKLAVEGGFSREERVEVRPWVFANIVSNLQSVCLGMSKLGLDFETRTAQEMSSQLLKWSPNLVFEENSFSLFPLVQTLLEDQQVQSCLKQGDQYGLSTSATYFFENISRFSHLDYLPSNSDVLRVNETKHGVTEQRVDLMNEFFMHLVDISRIRGERKKWIHMFENIDLAVFCVDLVCYYKPTFYASSTSYDCLRETLTYFESTISSMWFLSTPFVVLFTKTDLLQQDLETFPFSNFWPEYTGSNDYNSVCHYIVELFEQIAAKQNRTIYCHMVCATDTVGIKMTYETMREIIIKHGLEKLGLS